MTLRPVSTCPSPSASATAQPSSDWHTVGETHQGLAHASAAKCCHGLTTAAYSAFTLRNVGMICWQSLSLDREGKLELLHSLTVAALLAKHISQVVSLGRNYGMPWSIDSRKNLNDLLVLLLSLDKLAKVRMTRRHKL